MKTPQPVLPYSKAFGSEAMLHYHKREVHLGKSEIGDKSNNYKARFPNYKKGQITIKKLHKCPYCDKQLMTLTNIKEHILQKHEKNTPFKCEQCPQAFGIKSKLKSHIEIVHRRVKCDICDQEICNKLLLKRHKAKVHGIKPANVHHCKYCPLFFSIKAFLGKHLAKKHPEILENKNDI